MAGIRLAYILNECLSGGLNPTVKTLPDVIEAAPQYKTFKLEEINRHIGETVNVSSRVTGIKVFDNMVLVNFVGQYPNQLLTIVLTGDLNDFGKTLDNKLVGVRGRVILYKGKPEIVVTDPEVIWVRKTCLIN